VMGPVCRDGSGARHTSIGPGTHPLVETDRRNNEVGKNKVGLGAVGDCRGIRDRLGRRLHRSYLDLSDGSGSFGTKKKNRILRRRKGRQDQPSRGSYARCRCAFIPQG